MLQCEGVVHSLEASHSVALNVGNPGTPTGKLGSAIGQDNDRYINSEGDRQQLLLRWGVLVKSNILIALASHA